MNSLDSVSNRRHCTSFAGTWLSGAQTIGWTQRRRLMAALRMAHRVLGVNRNKLGLGALGFGGRARTTLLSSASPAGFLGGFGAILALGVAAPAQAVDFH